MVPISWTSSKITSEDSHIGGQGVFATKDIEKGERVSVLGGYTVSFDDLDKIKTDEQDIYETILSKGIQVDHDIIFSPISNGQFSDIEYLNHSCDPNIGFENQLHLIAMRDIKFGEELCMDYATCISNDLFDMECDCKSELCRKTITSNDWMISRLQEKYAGYFQPYLQKMITGLK